MRGKKADKPCPGAGRPRRPHANDVPPTQRLGRAFEPLEPRVLLSASTVGGVFAEPVSSSGAEVLANVGGEVVYQEQTQYDNFFEPNVISFDFAIDPLASSAQIDITALSDLDSLTETVTFNAEGIITTELFTAADDGVRPFTATINLSGADLNNLAADGNLHIELTPSSAVNDFGNVDEYVTVGLTYEIPGTPIALSPFGPKFSSVFTGSASGVFDAPNETVYYTVDLEAGQLVRFEAVPSAGVTVGLELRDPSGAVIFSETAPSSYPLLMQAVRVSMDGRYTLGVINGAETGTYSILADVNRAIENESVGRTSSGGIEQNMDIDPYFVSLSEDIERVTLLGTNGSYDPGGGRYEYRETFESGQLGPEWTISQAAFGQIYITDEYPTINGQNALLMNSIYNYNPNEAILTLNLADVTDATLSYQYRVHDEQWDQLPDSYINQAQGDGVSMSADGVNWFRIYPDLSFHSGFWFNASLDLVEAAQAAGITLGKDFKIKFQQYNFWDDITEGIGYDNIYVNAIRYLPLPSYGPDHFLFTLEPGQLATVRLEDLDNENHQVSFDLHGGSRIYDGLDEPGISIFEDLGTPSTRTFSVWVDPAGPYHLTITRGAVTQPYNNNTPEDAHSIWRTGNVIGAVEVAGEDRYFSVPVNPGDELTIRTSTPYDGVSGLNNLDPLVELYDTTGASVLFDDNSGSDGRNAFMTHTALQEGTYKIRVADAAGLTGAFVLEVSGHTGTEGVAFGIEDGYFDSGYLYEDAPYRKYIRFNEPTFRGTVQASDLLLNGVPAEAVQRYDDEYFEFDLDTSAAVEGLNTLSFAAGSIFNLHGDPLPYSESTFVLDTTPPTVVGSTVLEGDLLAAGDVIVGLSFSERITYLSENDVTLVGELTGLVTASSFTINETNDGVTVTYSGLPEDRYTFKLDYNENYPYIQDVAGNNLDGEANPLTTVPSGDGNDGGDFIIHFGTEDGTTQPLGLQLTPIEPLGSLVFEDTITGILDNAGDEDRYTFDLAAGDRLSLLVRTDNTGLAEASYELLGPTGAVAAAPSEANAEVNQFIAITGGTYTLVIRNTGDGRGEYVGTVMLNSYIELDPANRIDNPTPGQATDLNDAFQSLGGSSKQAIVIDHTSPFTGTLGDSFESGQWSSQWTYQTDRGVLLYDNYGGAHGDYAMVMFNTYTSYGFGEAVWTTDLTGVVDPFLEFAYTEWDDYDNTLPSSFSGSVNGDGVSISDDGVNWWTVLNAPQTEAGVWGWALIDLAAEAAAAGMTLGPDFKIKFQFYGSNSKRGYDAVRVSSAQTDAYYRVTLDAGESLTATLFNDDHAAGSLELLDAGGQLLAVGQPGWDTADEQVAGFVAPSAGDYILRVVNRVPGFKLVLTRDADFNIEPENALIDASLRNNSVVGAIGPVPMDTDTYRFRVSAGDMLDIWTETPDYGPTSSANLLDTHLQLFSPGGLTVASQGSGAAGLNARILHTAGEEGVYSLVVSGVADSTGGYLLHVEGPTDPIADMSVTDSSVHDGEVLSTAPNQFTVRLSHAVRLDTLQASDLTVAGIAAEAVNFIDPQELVFDIPMLAEGVNRIEIAAGALVGLNGLPVLPFAADVTLDTTSPRVISTTVNPNDSVESGDFSITLGFDETLEPLNLTASDARLIRTDKFAQFTPVLLTYDPVASVATFSFGAIEEGEYEFILYDNVYDLAFNRLDGETPGGPMPPNVSGDGVPGGNLVIPFGVDHTEPLELAPQTTPIYGSMSAGSYYNTGLIHDAEDQDTFRIYMQDGQLLSALLKPVGLVGMGPVGSTLLLEIQGVSSAAAGPDGPVKMTYLHDGPGGFVDVVVGNAVFSRGTEFNLDLFINTALEDTLPSAVGLGDDVLDLAPIFVSAGSDGVEVANVIGAGQLGLTRSAFGNLVGGNRLEFHFTDLPAPEGDGTVTLIALGDLGSSQEYLQVLAGSLSSGASLIGYAYAGFDGSELIPLTADLAVSQSILESRIVNGDLVVTVIPGFLVEDLGRNELTVGLSYPGLSVNPADTYAVDLQAGQTLSVAVESVPGNFLLEIIDAGTGQVLSAPTPSGGYDALLQGWAAPYSGTFLVRVTSLTYDEYRLSVVRGALLNTDPDASGMDLSPVAGSGGVVMGHLQSAGPARLFALTGSQLPYPYLSPDIIELDPVTLEPIRQFTAGVNAGAIPGGVNQLAYAGGWLYAAALPFDNIPPGPGVVYSLDPESGAIAGSFNLDQVGVARSHAFGAFGNQLVFQDENRDLVFVDPTTATQIRRLTTAGVDYATDLIGVVDRGSVFVLGYGSAGNISLTEVDATTGAIIRSLTLPQNRADSAAFINGELWVYNEITRLATAYDPDTGDTLGSTTLAGLNVLGLGADGVPSGPVADRYLLTLDAGKRVTIETTTPFDDINGSPLNDLDPAIRILDPNGSVVSFDDNSAGDGRNALSIFTALTSGEYVIEIVAQSGRGEYTLALTVVQTLIGDMTGDGFVGIEDLNTVLGNWNQSVTPGDLSQGDVTGDGFVGIEDLNAVLGNWNASLEPEPIEGDLDNDGFVGIADLNTVLGNWNQSVTPGDLTQGDPSNDGFMGIEDLNTVLGNWNTGTSPQVSAIARSASSAGETAEASASSSTDNSVNTNADRRTRRVRLSSQADDKPHTHTPGIAVISAWNSLNQRSEHQTHAGYVPRPLQQREKTPLVGLWEDNI